MDEARALLIEAEIQGDQERIVIRAAQLDEARQSYCKVLNAYVTICRRINEERQEIMQTLTGLSGAT